MSHFAISFLTLLLMLSGSCGVEPVTQKGPWSLKLTTSGGFAGVGTGNLSVDSEGKFSYEEPTSPQQVRKGCKGTLYNRQLQPLLDAVAQSNPKEWNRPDLNVAAPDAFGYKLELRFESDSEPTTVQWYDNTKDKLPSDLKRLSDVILQTMKTACHPSSDDYRSGVKGGTPIR
jgi:hypothetical protein